MKQLLRIGLLSLVLPLSIVATVSTTVAADVDFIGDSCTDTRGEKVCAEADTDGGQAGATALIKNIINGLIYLIAAISVIMIVYGGFRYVVSAGDSSAIQTAKNIILYAVVGLVVALTGYAIVNFILEQIW